jgi:hypothetical protein
MLPEWRCAAAPSPLSAAESADSKGRAAAQWAEAAKAEMDGRHALNAFFLEPRGFMGKAVAADLDTQNGRP